MDPHSLVGLAAESFLINTDYFTSTFVLQTMVNGITNGAIYTLMALSVVVIFRTTGHLNLAQGEMATLSAFVALTLSAFLPAWLVLPLVILLSGVMGTATERFLVRPVEARSGVAVLIVTLGLYLGINSVVAAIWGIENQRPLRVLPVGSEAHIVLLAGTPDLRVRYQALYALLAVALLVAVLWWLLQRTKLGLMYRAVASNRDSASLVGVPVSSMLSFGWGLAAAIGAVAALITAQLGNSLNFNLMGSVLIYGFAAACLGGFDSISGAVVGGLVVGLAESMIPNMFTFIGSEMGLGVALVVIVVVMAVRPEGLFGSRLVVRA